MLPEMPLLTTNKFVTKKNLQREQYKPWYLIGIVSFGSKKCGSGVPGIYTRVRNERHKSNKV